MKVRSTAQRQRPLQIFRRPELSNRTFDSKKAPLGAFFIGHTREERYGLKVKKWG